MNTQLRFLRGQHGWTMRQIARYLACHPSTYRRYETDRRALPLSAAIALADLYNVSLDELVGRQKAGNLNDL